MKAIRACLVAFFVASAVPASAAPIAIGEFAFNTDEFFQFFSVANLLAPGHSLAGLAWGATVVATSGSSEESFSLFDTTGDGLLGPGEAAQTFSDFFVGAFQSARLDFGTLAGFSASILTLPTDPNDLTAITQAQPATIFYDPEVASVPEPGTLLLIGSGLAFAALGARRRRA